MKLNLNVERVLEESRFPAFFLSIDNKILKVNEPFLRLLNKKREDLEGKYCYEVVHGLKELPNFCPLKEGEPCLLSGCETNTAFCPTCKICPEDKKTKSKGIFFKDFYEPRLKKYLRVTLFPLYEEDIPIGYLHFIEDETQKAELRRLLEAVVDTYPGLFFVNDEKFNILYMNENLKRLCNTEHPKCYELIFGNDKPCSKCPLLIEGKVEEEKEVYSPLLDKYFIRHFKIFKINSEKIYKITFYADITEQIRLFEESGIALVVSTPEGEILRVNRRARELFGVSDPALLKNYRDQDFWLNPEDRKAFIEKLIKEKKINHLEFKYKRLSGESYTALISSRLYEENGKKLIYSAFEDITEYLRLKEEAFNFIQRVLEFLPIGVSVIDTEDKVIFVNSRLSEITGYSIDELKGVNLHQLLVADPNLRKRAKEVFQKISMGEKSKLAKRRIEFQARRKTGELFPAEVYFDEFIFEGKRLFIGIIQDVTERKLIEEKLFREEKEIVLEKIAGGLAHDLNNLLMIIKGYLELLGERLKKYGEKELNYLSKVEEAFDRMKNLVSELFIISRGELKREEFINLGEFLKKWAPFYLKGSSVALTLDIEENLFVNLQENHLLSIIQNLILNAREAMENSGELRIKAQKVDNFIKVEVSDTGPGIPEEVKNKIFEPGFTTKAHGTGLGLYVVKRIMDMYNGKIEIFSHPGEGTSVTLFFPSVKSLKGVEVEPSKKAKGTLKVLVMDDEAEIREVLKEFLSEQGIQIETAEEGETAFEMILSAEREGNPYTHLILDLTVPKGKGGIYLLRRLQEIGFDLRKVKSIIITGFTEEELKKEAEGLNLDAILYKPFSLSKVLEVLK
ncbi:PAS/PAC sensor hybrid histidine kinase [Caldimicrobium thiodismutans]|uniref:histidine kinase n=1 Tax=Caldimicrobium thiodismutans TaxID=1653476 RepID=A0A0U5B6I3_9BACT|nr:PAS domain-containing protein [Caldimicrobium thiodismutans]BAU23696.1 PAS/PAC sensor hybrid histidine kinase [Caldimicrobium thiodismutans]